MPVDPLLEEHLDTLYAKQQDSAQADAVAVRAAASRARREGFVASTTSPVPAGDQRATMERETAPRAGLTDYTDPEAFAREKAKAFLAKFPDAPDSDLEQFREWAVRTKALNEARVSTRGATDDPGYANSSVLNKVGIGFVQAVDSADAATGRVASDFVRKTIVPTVESATGLKAASKEDVQDVINVGRKGAPRLSAGIEGASALAATLMSPAMKGGAAAARALGAGKVVQGAAGFGVHNAALQAGREIRGEDEGAEGSPFSRILLAGADGAVKGAAIAKVTPWLTKAGEAVAGRLIPGVGKVAADARVRFAAAIEQAGQNVLMEAVPSIDATGVRMSDGEGLDVQVFVGALFGAGTKQRFSDVFRRELGKAGLTPEQADALAPALAEALDATKSTPPDPTLLAQAEAARPAPEPSANPAEATAVLRDAVEKGLIKPEEVASPERAETYRQAEYEARQGGATPEQAAEVATRAVMDVPATTREDGSIAGPTVPTRQALAEGLVEGPARPIVERIVAEGGDTVSSGVGADGRPFAVGVDARGETIVERGEPPVPTIPYVAPPKTKPGKTLSQWVRAEGGIDYRTEAGQRGGWTGELDRLRKKGSGTTGLVRTDGKGKKLDALHRQAVSEGWMPEGSDLGEFVDAIEMDATGRGITPNPDDNATAGLEMSAAQMEALGGDTSFDVSAFDEPVPVPRGVKVPKGYEFVGQDNRDVAIFRQIRTDGSQTFVQRGVGGRLSPPHPAAIREAKANAAEAASRRAAEQQYRSQPMDEGDAALLRMGSGLGGADAATVKGALSLPHDIADAVVDPLNKLGAKALGGVIEGGKRVVDVVAKGADALLKFVGGQPALRLKERAKAAVAAALDTIHDKKQQFAAMADHLHKFRRRNDVGNMEKGAALRALTLDENGAAYSKEVHAVGRDYLYGDADRSALPPKYADAIDAIRDRIAQNHERLYELGLLGQDAYEFYKGVAEGYLRRDYVSDEAAAFLGHTGGKKIPKNHLKRDYPTVLWTEGEGFKRAKKFDPKDYASPEAAVAAAKDYAKQLKADGMVSGVSYVEPLTAEQRAKAGEVRDPRTILIRSLAIQEQQLANADLLWNLAADPTLAAPQEQDADGKAIVPNGFDPEPIPNDTRRYGALAGRHVPPAVRREVVGMFGPKSPLADWVITTSDNLLASWKMGKTVDNPATHARNTLGNVPFMEMAPNGASYFRPSDYPFFRDAHRLFTAKGPEAGVYWELAKALTGEGVGRHSDSLLGLESIDRAVKSLGGRPDEALRTVKERLSEALKTGDIGRIQEWFPGLRNVHDAMKLAYEYEDFLPRAAYALKQIKGGATVEAAAEATRRYFPTPTESSLASLQRAMSRGVRSALRQTVAPPFLGYTYEAARIMLDHARNRPASVAAIAGALKAITAMSASALGLSDDDIDTAQSNSPRYRPVGTLFTPLLPWRDADGNVQALDLRYIIPLGNEITGKMDWQGQYYSGLVNAPFAGLATDIWGNRSRLTGKPIWQDDPRSSIWQTPEEQDDAAWAYIRDTLLPSMAYVPGTPIKGTSAQRLERGLTGQAERSGEKQGPVKAVADTLLGLRTRSIRADDEHRARVLDLDGQMRARMQQIGRAEKKGDRALADSMRAELQEIVRKMRAVKRPSDALRSK